MRPFVFMFAVIFVFGSQDPVPKKHTETAHPDQHSQKAADYSKPGAQIVYVEGPSPNSDTDGQAKAGTSNNPSQHWWYRLYHGRSSKTSATIASVVRIMPAMLTAFFRASITTLVGSNTPAAARSQNSPVAAFQPDFSCRTWVAMV